MLQLNTTALMAPFLWPQLPAQPCLQFPELNFLLLQVDDVQEGLAGLVDEKSALITIDASGTIQTVNKACCQMLG